MLEVVVLPNPGVDPPNPGQISQLLFSLPSSQASSVTDDLASTVQAVDEPLVVHCHSAPQRHHSLSATTPLPFIEQKGEEILLPLLTLGLELIVVEILNGEILVLDVVVLLRQKLGDHLIHGRLDAVVCSIEQPLLIVRSLDAVVAVRQLRMSN